MNQEIIDALIELAVNAFNKNKPPAAYAKIAAHKAAFEAAYKYHPDLADLAALAAAAEFFLEVNEAIHFSAHLADAATQKLSSESAYNAAWQTYSSNNLVHSPMQHHFSALAEAPNQTIHHFYESVSPAYEIGQVSDVVARNKAKRAALYVYRDVYATTRMAYIRALFIANESQDVTKRSALFRKEITARLNDALSYDRVDPSIWLTIMVTSSLRVIAGVILLLGIGAILLAAFQVTPIPIIPLACAGGASVATGAGLFIGSFFARKSYQNIMEVNENRPETCALTSM